jgi:hypothetical protein
MIEQHRWRMMCNAVGGYVGSGDVLANAVLLF